MAARKGRIHYVAITLLTLVLSGRGTAQNASQTPRSSTPASIYSLWPAWPKARQEDVQSIQSIINAYFDGYPAAQRLAAADSIAILADGRFAA